MSLLPDMTPIEATRRLLDVSVTERGTFRSCRRRWLLTTLENLEPVLSSEIALSFGTGMHSALDAYYGTGNERSALDRFENWANEQKKKTPEGTEWEVLMEHVDLGRKMLLNYFDYEKTAKVKLGRPLAVEGQWIDEKALEIVSDVPDGYPEEATVRRHESGRLLVPIVDPETKSPIDRNGYFPMLTARIDLLSERKTPKKGWWIVDHKNLSSSPPDGGLDFDDQITGYCYVVWRWTGVIPRGVVYNQLIKKVPKEPRLVKGKKKDEGLVLSTAKDQLTTPALYREALKDHGLMSGNKILSELHADCMAALLSRGWDPFFLRYEAMRNEHELRSFERRLAYEYMDMEVAEKDAEACYPNPDIRKCPYCPVRSICLAMEDGSDYEDVIEHQFREAPDRKAA